MRKMSATPESVGNILSARDIKQLTRNYDKNPSAIADLSLDMFNTLYPGGSTIFTAINERFYPTHGQEPATILNRQDVERCVITMLAAEKSGPFLAIHCYWGIVVGLLPDDIAETLLLVGTYQGVDSYTQGLRVLAETLMFLKEHVHEDPVTMVRGLLDHIGANTN